MIKHLFHSRHSAGATDMVTYKVDTVLIHVTKSSTKGEASPAALQGVQHDWHTERQQWDPPLRAQW